MPSMLDNTTIHKSENAVLNCYNIRAVCPPHTELHYLLSVLPAHGSLRIEWRTELELFPFQARLKACCACSLYSPSSPKGDTIRMQSNNL